MSAGKPRKLLAPPILARLARKRDVGVPLARLIKDHDLDISSPHLAKLIGWFDQESDEIQNSLFPPWLDYNSIQVQEQPDNFSYTGLFPFGYWKQDH